MDSNAISTVLIAVICSAAGVYLAMASFISFYENQQRAGVLLLILSVVVIISGLFGASTDWTGKGTTAIFLAVTSFSVFLIYLKEPVTSPSSSRGIPIRNIDEHDVVFSRMRLKPGTEEWHDYYSSHPLEAKADEVARSLPGLLSEEGTQFNYYHFKVADSNFTLIEYLQRLIYNPASPVIKGFGEEELTEHIKRWARYRGVHSIGITELKDYHLYTVRGRGPDKGRPVIKRHKYAIAFTVEMDHRNIQAAPASPVIFESSHKYLDCAIIALQISTFLKEAGYDSRAHIDGDYELICPLVARDAGLGEIGRMGLLMTPSAGPRVRIAVVTTNAPLVTGKTGYDNTVEAFCHVCRKCSECCPGKAIPGGDWDDADGTARWKIDSDACYKYWCKTGTDCGRCIAVCPYSHPDNIFHRTVRHMIRRSSFITHIAYYADILLYGRRPAPVKHKE